MKVFDRYFLLVSTVLALVSIPAPAQFAGAITYQGQLEQSETPATGDYDFEFLLHDSQLGGNLISGPVTRQDVFVDGGLFAVVLDFGTGAFEGSDRWLEIAVRESSAGGAYTVLSPRQPITAAPLALHAETATTADSVVMDSIGSAEIAPGSVGSSDIDPAQVQRRIASGCSAGEAIRSIESDGSVTCEATGSLQSPAGASSKAFFDSTSLTGTVVSVGSHDITVPGDGVVVAIGTGSFNLSHNTSAPTARALFSLSTNSDFHGVRTTSVAAGDLTNNLDIAATAIGVFPVAAGTHTIHLMASKASGENSNANARDLALLLIYLPMEYGLNTL